MIALAIISITPAITPEKAGEGAAPRSRER
jgi:hypothetical protein